jgi:hypothetical protein
MIIKIKMIKTKMMQKYKNNIKKLIMQIIKEFKKYRVQQ